MKTFSEASKSAKPKKKSVVFAFGRMNPPTTGHGVLVKKVTDEASSRSADHFIFVSKSQEPKKNPLTHAQKVSYLRKLFPKGNFPLNKAANPYEAVLYLCELGYTDITMIAGSDQVANFKGIAAYKGKVAEKDPKKRKYSFDSFKVVQAGEERVEKVSLNDIDKMLKKGNKVDPMYMSASLMRAAAFAKRFDIFSIGIPGNKTLAKQLYNDVRKGMGLSEEYIYEATDNPADKVTILALTSSEKDLSDTIEKMEVICKKRKIEFYAVKTSKAQVDISNVASKKITIKNYDGEEKDVTIIPENTVAVVRGGVMNSDIGVAIMTILQNNGVFMINERGGMELCANKLETAIALKKHNLPHPRTAFVANEENIETAVKEIGGKFPVIVKTLTGAEGIGVSKIESMESLKSVLQTLWKYGAEVIMQEFLPNFKNDVRSIVLNGKIFACAKRDKAPKDFRTNIARGSKGGSFQLSEEEIKLVEEAARVSKCYYVGIDHVINDGKPYIIEMNASPGSGNIYYRYYEGGKGKDNVKGEELVEDFVNYIIDKTHWKLFSNLAVREKITIEGTEYDAKVDTGNSGYNMIHGTDIKDNGNHTVTFTLPNGKRITKKIVSRLVVKSGIGKKKRMVVMFDVKFHGKTYPNIKFSVGDRDHMSTKVLLGLQFLSKTGIVVDPAQAIYPQNQTQQDDKEIKEAYKTKSGKTVSPPRDKKADQPKKYVAGLSKTQATKRKSQFKKRAELPDSDPRAWKKLPGDPKETEKKSKYTQLFAKKFGSKKEEVADMVNSLMILETSDIPLSKKIEKAREMQIKAASQEQKETCDIYIEAMKAEMYEPYSNIKTTLDEDFEWMLVNSMSIDSLSRRIKARLEERQLQGTDEIVKAYSKMTPGQKFYSEEDNKEENDALYKEWRKLVNMGPKELQGFIDSEGGKEAGLSRKEASKAGAKGKKIKSGRDSARAIVRMKEIGKEKWTANDWAWAKRQVNFINRMKGAAGKLREPDGTPTRKLLALKIWGHNPET
jgi:ribosomal protein S6--L-glutamate ligase